jgi:acetoacetate decarboxylase
VLRALLPASLAPDGSNTVVCEFAATPDVNGRGSHTEFNLLIPALVDGERVLYCAYSTTEPSPWRLRCDTRMVIVHDTLTGIVELHGRPIVIASMNYRRAHLLEASRRFGALSAVDTMRQLRPARVTEAIGDDRDTSSATSRLIAVSWSDIHVQCAWTGPASLDFLWPANSPLATLAVGRVHGGLHCVVDFRCEPPRRLSGATPPSAVAAPSWRTLLFAADGGVQ